MFFGIKRPLVSVVIASYNHEKYVQEAVRSVLRQSIKKIEVIVVDDGSPDNTLKRISEIKDNRLKVIGLPKNRQTHPRNLALGLVRGEYIAFQNSDDVWEPDKLAKQVSILQANKEVSACFSEVQYINESGHPSTSAWVQKTGLKNKQSAEWLREFFDRGNSLCISSACVRSSSLRKVGSFRPSLMQLSDLDLWIRLVSVGKFHVLSEKLTKMRIIKMRNLSAPTPPTRRRVLQELTHVLQRFTDEYVLNASLPGFTDVIPDTAQYHTVRCVALALYAYKSHVAHRIFADKVIADVLDDEQKRAEVLSFFGPQLVHRFIDERSKIVCDVQQ